MQKKHRGMGVCLPAWEGITSKGTFERRPHSKHPAPLGLPGPLWPPWPGSDLSPPLSASPLCSRHTGLLAVPQTCQARSYLRTFSLSVPSARKPLPPDLRVAHVLTPFRSLLQCPLVRAVLPQPPAFIVHPAHHSTPLPSLSFLPVYITWHYFIFICLSCLLKCKPHKDRAFVFFITESRHSQQWCLIHVVRVLVLIVMIVHFLFYTHSWLVQWGCLFSVFRLSKASRTGCEGSPDVFDLSLLELLCFLCLYFMMSALWWLRNKDPTLPRKTVSSGWAVCCRWAHLASLSGQWLCCQRWQQPLLSIFFMD